MAPNSEQRLYERGSTFYGALDLNEDAKQASSSAGSVRWLVGMAVVSVCVTASVFAMASSDTRPVAANTVVDEMPVGDDLKDKDDCLCQSGVQCLKIPGAYAGQCVIEDQVAPDCIGFDYTPPYRCSPDASMSESKMRRVMEAQDTAECTLQGGTWSADWKSHCEFIEGRYDCYAFPCVNGGYCVDGTEDYTCVCPFGYEGSNCELEIDECSHEGDGAVCHEYATCANTEGSYSCACNPGFFGDGYAVDQVNVMWGSILTTDAIYGWLDRTGANFTDDNNDGVVDRFGCTDINDCASTPCFNGGLCVDTWDGHAKYDDGTEVYRQDDARSESNAFICDCEVTLPLTRFAGDYCQLDVDECGGGLHNCDKDDRSECTNNEGSFSCNCREFWEGDGYSANTNATKWGCYETNGCKFWQGYEGCADIDDCLIPQFTGEDADGDGAEDLIMTSPCQNGATCTNDGEGTGEYHCFCVVGWRGHDCEIDIDECLEFEEEALGCDINAYCNNVPGSWQCLCNNGWTGDGHVEGGCYDADDCEFSPCQHGGTCTDCGTLCYICDCVVGWRGKSCEIDWDECIMGIHTCHDMAMCINVPGSFECECEPGYSGDGYAMCEEVNDCLLYEDDQDSNDLTLVDYAVKVYDAQGNLEKAETPVENASWMDDYPASVDGELVHQCGEWDRIKRIFKEHGTCEDVGPAAFVCTCDAGWSDSNCDLDINECARATDICHKYGTCVNIPGSYYCQCNTGFTGDGVAACNDIDDCSYGPEKCDMGFCTDLGVGDFRCTCNEGYTDRLCNTNIDECASMTHTCTPDEKAICTDTNGSFKCACAPGFFGDGIGPEGCTDIDDCGSAPCENGECQDNGRSSYSCTCDVGWTDVHCDHDVNECYMGTHDCHPDGKCVNTPGRYYCRCVSGYTGDGYTCTDLDDCDPDPCDPVQGTCSDNGANRYVCTCIPGICGAGCESDCVECDDGTHECDPNADCFNTYGSYICACKDEFYGDGVDCAPCSVCQEECVGEECKTGPGYTEDKKEPPCEAQDRTCRDINECSLLDERIHNCDEHADCINGVGSFNCECVIADEYWGTGIDGECYNCATCGDGEYMFDDCTSTTDRDCRVILEDGNYAMQTDSGSVLQCLVHWKEPGKIYPERYSWGGRTNTQTETGGEGVEPFSETVAPEDGVKPGVDYCRNPICGVCDWNDNDPKDNLVKGMEAVWTFKRLKDDLYLILNGADGQGFRCFGFQTPAAPYPSFISWKGMAVEAATGICNGTSVECESLADCEDDSEAAVAANFTGFQEWNKECKKEVIETGEWLTDGKGVEFAELEICEYNRVGLPTSCKLNYFCGFETNEGGSAFEKMMSNGGTVWNVKQLGCSVDNERRWLCAKKRKYDNQFMIRSLARGDLNRDGVVDKQDYECLYFPQEGGGQYSHPRRAPLAASDDGTWLGMGGSSDVDGNGDVECGIYANVEEDETQEDALVNNKQAVFGLISLPSY